MNRMCDATAFEDETDANMLTSWRRREVNWML
jgi:hypothetical protein